MSSTAQLSNSSDKSTIHGIIPALIELVSKAKESIPLSPQTNTNTTATDTATAAAAGPDATSSTVNIVNSDSSISHNNVDNSNSASLPKPDNSNPSAPAPASGSGSGSASTSTSSSFSGSGSGSTSTTAANSGSNNTTAPSNNGDISNEISDVSCWMLGFFDKKPSGANKKKDDNTTVDDVNDGSVNFDHESKEKLHNQLDKLEKDLKYVKNAFDKLKVLEQHAGAQFKNLQVKGESLQSVITKMGQLSKGTSGNQPVLTKQLQFYVKAITEMVMELKYHVPSPYAMMLPNESQENDVEISASDSLKLIDEMIKIRDNNVFQECLAFEDFEANYKSLDLREKLCLLCFAVFPENALVKKRLLTYWWIGEGFIPDPKLDRDKMGEEVADEILKRFLENGFIKPEIKKRRLIGFRMHSLIRYAVIFVAARVGFFDFDSIGNPTAKFPSCQRACLNKIGEKYSRKDLPSLEPEKLHALFNVNDPYPDFNADWFSRMRNVNVLYLGRWEKLTKAEETNCHVEVDSTYFLKGLRNMKHLKFLSLQGISRINELPGAIEGLVNLRILDLNACHNLEALQENIVCLQNLTHLDISECFMLDCMPKGLGSLTELQVLKGFVISNLKIKNAGTLDDLKGLTKLRKLSIYTTKKDFPRVQDLDALRHITNLQKLTIAWGGKSRAKKETNQIDQRRLTRVRAFRQDDNVGMSPDLPENLLKLDLQCYPEAKAPSWLSPIKLTKLEKLYIRGGHISDLGQAQGGNVKWNVKILRLKFLQELKMDWRVLHNAFPKLIYLEKFNCPKLTFFPCDGSGVWINRNELSEQALKELEFTWSFLSARAT